MTGFQYAKNLRKKAVQIQITWKQTLVSSNSFFFCALSLLWHIQKRIRVFVHFGGWCRDQLGRHTQADFNKNKMPDEALRVTELLPCPGFEFVFVSKSSSRKEIIFVGILINEVPFSLSRKSEKSFSLILIIYLSVLLKVQQQALINILRGVWDI